MGSRLHPKDRRVIPEEPNKLCFVCYVPTWFINLMENVILLFLEPALIAAAHFFPCSCGARAFFSEAASTQTLTIFSLVNVRRNNCL